MDWEMRYDVMRPMAMIWYIEKGVKAMQNAHKMGYLAPKLRCHVQNPNAGCTKLWRGDNEKMLAQFHSQPYFLWMSLIN
jgi:hypothetical protein